MSKSARLKRIKQDRMKNDEAFRKKEEERKNSSKAVKKFVRSESIWVKLLKFIMVLPFLYSGFFYGGITIIGILKRYIENIDTYVGIVLLICLAAMLLAIILTFKRFYIPGFILSLISVLTYFFITKKYFVDFVTGKVAEDGNINPEYKYMIWFYPILLFLLCSFILLIIDVFRLIKKKRREKEKKDNAPTKSIVD